MRKLVRPMSVVLATCMLFIGLQFNNFVVAQPSSVMTSSLPGWNIYSGGIYRYGPSIMINPNNSIDMWFSSPGTNSVIDMYAAIGTHTAVQLTGSNTAAQRFSAKWSFGAIQICAPSWGNSIGNLTLKLYKWTTDYNTSLAAAPLAARTYVNFNDGEWLNLDAEIQAAGDYIWVASSPTETVGLWKETGSSYLGNVNYLNGSVVAGDYNVRIIDSADHFTNSGAQVPVQLTSGNTAAQKFVSNNDFDAFSVNAPSWSNNVGNLTLKLYKWNTDYNTTIASAVIATKQFVNYTDNTYLKMDIAKQVPGTYMWVASDSSEVVGLYKYASSSYTGNINYLNGNVTTGDYKTRVYEVNWDVTRYKNSTDGGHTWSQESIVMKPSPGTKDAMSVCDPGAIKIGAYYYIGYTSTIDTRGTDNDLYICRSTSPSGPYEKWNGTGWGGAPQPMITYTDSPDSFGSGEPSFVLKDGTIYIYYSWNNQTGSSTRVATALSSNANWPGSLTQKGTALTKDGGSDHLDVKYIDAYGKFFGVCTANRLTATSYVALYESVDGITFVPSKTASLTQNIKAYCHNAGISGDQSGHIDLTKNNFIAYAYGPNWANWNTFLNPITFSKYSGADVYAIHMDAGSNTQISILDRNTSFSTFSLQKQLPLGITTSTDWQFIMADYNGDTIKDLYCIQRNGASGKLEVHVLNGADDYQTWIADRTTSLSATDSSWSFLVGDYNGDGINDLYCIDREAASGYTEVDILSGANNFTSVLLHKAIYLGTTLNNYNFLLGDYNSDGKLDIYMVQKQGGSGKTEVHILSGSDNFTTYLLHKATVFGITDQNYDFGLGDYNYDGKLDLYAIFRNSGGSNTEVHIMNGNDNFDTYLSNLSTVLGKTDSSWMFDVK